MHLQSTQQQATTDPQLALALQSCALDGVSMHHPAMFGHPTEWHPPKRLRRMPCMQAKMVHSTKAKGGQEIPVPKVTLVPTYNIDYLPTFREQSTYIRGRGARNCHGTVHHYAGQEQCSLVRPAAVQLCRNGCIWVVQRAQRG